MFGDLAALHLQHLPTQCLWHSTWPGTIITQVSDSGGSDADYPVNAAMKTGSW